MAGLVWRLVGKLAAILAWMPISAEGVSYTVSTCKEFEAIPTPMLDDTHVVITKDIACRSVSIPPSLQQLLRLVCCGLSTDEEHDKKKRGKVVLPAIVIIFWSIFVYGNFRARMILIIMFVICDMRAVI